MENLIIKYLNKEASKEEKIALLTWIKEDEINKERFLELYKTWMYSDTAIDTEDDANVAFLHFKENVMSYEKSKRNRRLFLYPKWVAVASILILFFSVGSFFLGKSISEPNAPNQMYTVIMGKGSKGSIMLPDSTLVWLNSNSRLIYPEKFEENSRIVKLEGEGYFEVTKNEKKPFYVETEKMTINVLGTCFDIRNYKEANVIETTLLSGSVEVHLTELNSRTILKPNQKLSYNSEKKSVRINEFKAEEQILWINDQLEFSNEKLSDIFRKLEYWYGINIVCSKNVNENQRLSFVVRKETEEEILKLLSFITPITYSIENNEVTINTK